MTAVAEVVGTESHALETRDAEARRKLTLLKAVGLDRVSPEQRELAIAIAKRYDLDLLLKHLVLIDGKPYVTRDALLWIAHRDGNLDGIEVSEPVIRDYQGVDYWFTEASVYRKDMSRPFKYGGRYPVKGQNAKFGPEMATKVAEAMALRRAFNISAPTQDERWDVDVPTAEPEQPKSLAEKVAERAQAVAAPVEAPTETPEPQNEAADAVPVAQDVFEGEIVTDPEGQSPLEQAIAAMPTQCESKSPFAEGEEAAQCKRETGHPGPHKTRTESWPR